MKSLEYSVHPVESIPVEDFSIFVIRSGTKTQKNSTDVGADQDNHDLILRGA